MGKARGHQCCAYGCSKRKYSKEGTRSDSEGSSDEETALKRKFPRTFHRLPLNEEKRKQWAMQIHREGWVPTIHSKICSDHFKERDIDRTGCGVRIRENAVPTRFKNFPGKLKKAVETYALIPGKLPTVYPPTPASRLANTSQNQATSQSANTNSCETPTDTTEAEQIDLSQKAKIDPTSSNNSSNSFQVNSFIATLQKGRVSKIPKFPNSLCDHDYTCITPPSELLKKLHAKDNQIALVRKKLKVTQQKCRRLTAKVASLKEIVKDLKQDNHVLSKMAQKTNETLSEVPSMAMFESPGSMVLVDELLELDDVI